MSWLLEAPKVFNYSFNNSEIFHGTHLEVTRMHHVITRYLRDYDPSDLAMPQLRTGSVFWSPFSLA